MAELTRSYAFVILLYVVVCVYLLFRTWPRRFLVGFLIPIVILSGGWHAYQRWQFGQVTWSNHTGFNLLRAWPMIERPPLTPESGSTPLHVGRWENLNTADHYENSQRLTGAVVKYVARHPIASALHVLERFGALLITVATDIYSHKPRDIIFYLYRPLVWIMSASLLGNLIVFGAALIKGEVDRRQLLAAPEHILLATTAFCVAALALGDAGEEARFLISLLPLLIATFNNPLPSLQAYLFTPPVGEI